jgi:hypothetical protein
MHTIQTCVCAAVALAALGVATTGRGDRAQRALIQAHPGMRLAQVVGMPSAEVTPGRLGTGMAAPPAGAVAAPPVGAAGAPPVGAVGAPPVGAVGAPPLGAVGTAPVGAAGGAPAGAAGPAPRAAPLPRPGALGR